MGAESNLDVDKEAVKRLLQTMQQVILTTIDDSKNDVKTKLANACFKKIAGGETPMYVSVKKDLIEDMERALMTNNVPFVTTPTSGNQAMIIIAKSDYADFESTLNVVKKTSAFYSKNVSELDIVKGAQMMGGEVVTMTYASQESALLAQEKLYQCNIPSAISEKEGGGFEVIFQNQKSYSKSGNDFGLFKIKMASEAVKDSDLFSKFNIGGKEMSFLDIRMEEGKIDKEEYSKFAKKVADGKPAVIADPTGKSKSYIEFTGNKGGKNGKIYVCKPTKDGMRKEELKLSYRDEVQKNPKTGLFEPTGKKVLATSEEQIMNLISKHVGRIDNCAVMDKEDYNLFIASTPDKKSQEYKDFIDGNYTSKRGKFANAKSMPEYEVYKSEMEPFMEKLNNDATRYINEQVKVKKMDMSKEENISEAEKMKTDFIRSKLVDETYPYTRRLLYGDASKMSIEKRKQWLDRMSDALDGKNDFESKISYNVDIKTATKSLVKSVAEKMAGKELEKYEEQEKEA